MKRSHSFGYNIVVEPPKSKKSPGQSSATLAAKLPCEIISEKHFTDPSSQKDRLTSNQLFALKLKNEDSPFIITEGRNGE